MPNSPDTRPSLILKLSDAKNAQAWDEFLRLYQPVVYRIARRNGFQHADAEEVVQEAMLAVSRAVDRWSPDASRGRFRDWLYRIARNLMINFVSRRKHQLSGAGGSGLRQLFENLAAPTDADSGEFDLEFHQEMFRFAAERVQQDVTDKTWRAFWLTTVEDLPGSQVGETLGMSVGSVYIARSRVMARLREAVRQLQEEDSSAMTQRPSS